MKTAGKNAIFYPPGGILIWILIFLELITFGIALLAMVYEGGQDPVSFHQSRLLLNPTLGTLNTLILLSSGYFMALSVGALKKDNAQLAKRHLVYAMLLGFAFLGVKGFEYYQKIGDGLVLGYNTFFDYYWLLTLFHVIHVIVGLVILGFQWFGMRANHPERLDDLEASAAFWHMCDLIWLLLFPLLYLFF
ncbi:cytochrome c oxidase subunit 3 [Sediminicola luteus]|uniref:Nitric oxide reductase n=1 Tax=Sediminicola luteus TaxID=319238 RepID=A0A2A4GDX5_9FLAO|nr:cytochrome c oxidase subunit 3 [Sediminicola luteus]PCE66186.1 nitric oxide reductase [Sediminicola luteus]